MVYLASSTSPPKNLPSKNLRLSSFATSPYNRAKRAAWLYHNGLHCVKPKIILINLVLSYVLRRRKDSNLRAGFPANTLAVCCFRPLSHASVRAYIFFEALHGYTLFCTLFPARGLLTLTHTGCVPEEQKVF